MYRKLANEIQMKLFSRKLRLGDYTVVNFYIAAVLLADLLDCVFQHRNTLYFGIYTPNMYVDMVKTG